MDSVCNKKMVDDLRLRFLSKQASKYVPLERRSTSTSFCLPTIGSPLHHYMLKAIQTAK